MKLFKKKDRLLLGGTIILGGISAAMSAFVSILLQKIIDAATRKDMAAFSNLFIITLVYLAFLGVMGFLEAYCGKLMLRNVTMHLREDLFGGVMSRSPVRYASRNTADYLSALVNDVKLVEENYLLPLLLCCQMVILFAVTLGILFYLSPAVTIVLLVLLVLMFLVPGLLGKRLQKKQDAYSAKLSDFTAKAKDFLNGYEVIRGYSMRSYIYKKFARINKETAGKKFSADTLLAVNECFSDILSALIVIVVVFISAYLMLTGHVTMGTLLALIQLSSTFITPVVLLTQNLPKVTSMKPVLAHLAELAEVPEDFRTTSASNAASGSSASVVWPFYSLTCTDVTYGYLEEQTVLDRLSLSIKAGGKYALLGESGCGKSTLIKLLTGYSMDFDGDIRYNNVSVRDLNQRLLNRMTCVIHQNVFLFDTDIYENICLGETFSKEELDRALEDSGVSQFLSGLENGVYSKVGENGQNLSGGQRQRIAVARALIRHTPILIIDEGTSAVDQKTAYEIEKNLLAKEDLTILIITHHPDERLAHYYTQVFRLQNGRLAGSSSITSR